MCVIGIWFLFLFSLKTKSLWDERTPRRGDNSSRTLTEAVVSSGSTYSQSTARTDRYRHYHMHMKGGWKVPTLFLATTSRFSVGFLFNQPRGFTKIDRISRRMSSEVRLDQDFGPTDQSWRSLLEVSIAKSRKIRGSNYVQISTVNKEGEPRCRTVVFRGFLNGGNLPEDHAMSPQNGGDFDGKPVVMKMCTDLRSKKVGEVAHQPISEMVRTPGRAIWQGDVGCIGMIKSTRVYSMRYS